VQVGRLIVRKGGAFLVGSAQAPHAGVFNLILEANATLGEPLASNPTLGDRLLSVRGGRLELFASARMLPWGTLQRRTLTGESTIHLRVAPGWKVSSPPY
jgi:hypothetical protein